MHIRSKLFSIWRNNDGSAALISAIVIPLSILLLFITADTGRMYVVKSKVQEAMDSALLGAVATRDTKDIAEEFEQLFRANVNASYSGAKISDANAVMNSAAEFNATANVRIPLSYRWFSRSNNVTFTVESGVYAGFGVTEDRTVEIALALDNTGSMVGSRIAALKNASKDLIDIVFGSTEQLNNVFVSIIPYDIVVGVGSGREDWIQDAHKVAYNAFAPKGFVSNRRSDLRCANYFPGNTWVYCKGSYCWGELCYPENCYPAQPPFDTTVCDQETKVCTVVHNPGYPAGCYPAYCAPAGCCTERTIQDPGYWYRWGTCTNNGLIDADDTPPTAGENWKFRIPYGEAGTEPVLYGNPLEDSFKTNLAPVAFAQSQKKAIKDSLDAMTISGATRIHVGLMWGWFTLSSKWQGIWDGAKPSLPKTMVPGREKILVLMTDGQNYDLSDNAVTLEVCNAIKASPDNITLYTVGFGGPQEVDKDLLRNCASDPSKFFYAPTGKDLKKAFRQIGGDIVYPTIRVYK